MIEKIKNNLMTENSELRREINTLENKYETLKDERIDKLIEAINKQDKNEELEEKVKKLEIRNQQLKDLIKELKAGKNEKK